MYKVKTFKKFDLKYDKKKRSRIALLVFRKVHSNWIFTLVDQNFKVIKCITSGYSNPGETVRKKVSSYAMEKISLRLKEVLILYKINCLEIVLRSKATGHLFALINWLSMRNIVISGFHERIRVPHNGVRGRNLRRR